MLETNFSSELYGSPSLFAQGYPYIMHGSNNVYGRVGYVHSIP